MQSPSQGAHPPRTLTGYVCLSPSPASLRQCLVERRPGEAGDEVCAQPECSLLNTRTGVSGQGEAWRVQTLNRCRAGRQVPSENGQTMTGFYFPLRTP